MITLMYHNLVARPEADVPEVSYQVSLAGFSQHLARLAPRLLKAALVRDTLQDRQRPPRGTLLTFDDGGAGLLDGIEILRAHQAQAVVFVCPGQLESGLWFNRLAWALASRPAGELHWRGRSWTLPRQRQSAHDSLVHEWQGWSQREREQAVQELTAAPAAPPPPPPPALRTADESQLRRLVDSGCFMLGNHSWSHSNLARRPSGEVEEEVDQAQHWIEASGMPSVPWFAFPHGGYDDRVVRIVKSRGLVPFGSPPGPMRPDVFPRIGIYPPDACRWRFEAKLLLARAAELRTRGRSSFARSQLAT